MRLYYGKNNLESYETYRNTYGVFQGALAISYLYFSTYYTDLLLGTHVGNDPSVMLASYANYGAIYDFSFHDFTYSLLTCESYTESYIQSYGATYAATYYKRSACNVRAIEWI